MNPIVRNAVSALAVLAVGVVLIMMVVATRPRNEAEVTASPPPSVFVERVKFETLALTVTAQGEVRPLTEIAVSTQVAGNISRTAAAFVDGGAFEAGELLVEIEDADYRLAVTRAAAQVAQAAQALEREKAESDLARSDWAELGGEGPASALALRQPQLAQARANYDAAAADLEIARLNLSRTKVKAPFNGRVRQRLVGEGQYVAPGGQLARIFATDAAEIPLPLTDEEFGRLGLPLAFEETEAAPGPNVALSAVIGGEIRNWEGRVARTGAAIDPRTRQISVFAVVDNPYGAQVGDTPLIAGLFVNATIEGRAVENAMRVPRSALHADGAVYVVDAEDRLVARSIDIIARTPDGAVIRGLEDGARIIVSPLGGAAPGDLVNAIDRNAAQQAGEDALADAGLPADDKVR